MVALYPAHTIPSNSSFFAVPQRARLPLFVAQPTVPRCLDLDQPPRPFGFVVAFDCLPGVPHPPHTTSARCLPTSHQRLHYLSFTLPPYHVPSPTPPYAYYTAAYRLPYSVTEACPTPIQLLVPMGHLPLGGYHTTTSPTGFANAVRCIDLCGRTHVTPPRWILTCQPSYRRRIYRHDLSSVATPHQPPPTLRATPTQVGHTRVDVPHRCGLVTFGFYLIGGLPAPTTRHDYTPSSLDPRGFATGQFRLDTYTRFQLFRSGHACRLR